MKRELKKKERAPIILTTVERVEVTLNELDEKQTQELAEYILQEDEMEVYLWGNHIGLIFDWSMYSKQFSIVDMAQDFMDCKSDWDANESDKQKFDEYRLNCIKALQKAIVILGG